MSEKQPSEPQPKVSVWEFLRDVLITGMNRGQLLGITLSIVVIVFVIRAPLDVLISFGRDIFQALIDSSLTGYLLFVGSLLGWRAHTKRLRDTMESELRSISHERNRLQNRELGGLLQSSNDENTEVN